MRTGLLFALGLPVSCAGADPTLFQPCTTDEDCGEALSCLEAERPTTLTPPTGTAPLTEAICTTSCAADGDCPIQDECGGTGDLRRARCVSEVCSVRVCD